MKEIWKDIKGYEGYYQVSNYGRVKSLDRYVNHNTRKSIFLRKGKILKPYKNNTGYLQVTLRINNKNNMFLLHRLIYQAFIDRLLPNLQIDHIDNNPLNNCIDNLQQVTNRENCSKDKKGVSKYTGVSWNKNNNKWQVKIYIKKKLLHLGLFTDELEAAEAYQNKLNSI